MPRVPLPQEGTALQVGLGRRQLDPLPQVRVKSDFRAEDFGAEAGRELQVVGGTAEAIAAATSDALLEIQEDENDIDVMGARNEHNKTMGEVMTRLLQTQGKDARNTRSTYDTEESNSLAKIFRSRGLNDNVQLRVRQLVGRDSVPRINQLFSHATTELEREHNLEIGLGIDDAQASAANDPSEENIAHQLVVISAAIDRMHISTAEKDKLLTEELETTHIAAINSKLAGNDISGAAEYFESVREKGLSAGTIARMQGLLQKRNDTIVAQEETDKYLAMDLSLPETAALVREEHEGLREDDIIRRVTQAKQIQANGVGQQLTDLNVGFARSVSGPNAVPIHTALDELERTNPEGYALMLANGDVDRWQRRSAEGANQSRLLVDKYIDLFENDPDKFVTPRIQNQITIDAAQGRVPDKSKDYLNELAKRYREGDPGVRDFRTTLKQTRAELMDIFDTVIGSFDDRDRFKGDKIFKRIQIENLYNKWIMSRTTFDAADDVARAFPTREEATDWLETMLTRRGGEFSFETVEDAALLSAEIQAAAVELRDKVPQILRDSIDADLVNDVTFAVFNAIESGIPEEEATDRDTLLRFVEDTLRDSLSGPEREFFERRVREAQAALESVDEIEEDRQAILSGMTGSAESVWDNIMGFAPGSTALQEKQERAFSAIAHFLSAEERARRRAVIETEAERNIEERSARRARNRERVEQLDARTKEIVSEILSDMRRDPFNPINTLFPPRDGFGERSDTP